jgi:DnaJ-class molecular chaperone
MADHYQTLGVAKNATPDDIKKAYRKLASKHHPDKGGDTATFQKIQTAYDTLSDPQKRQQHDNPSPFQDFGAGGFPGGFSFNTGGGFNDVFSEFFKQANQQQQRRATQIYRTSVVVSLEQAYTGAEQLLKIQSPTGHQMVKIDIPKGVQDGAQVRIGDVLDGATLIVEFRVQKHLRFERNGNDLYCNQPISVLDLIVGTTVEFTTISGSTLEVKIPPNTQPHMQMKISGHGMPINDTIYGDQILLLKPFLPDNIDVSIIDSIKQAKAKN